MKGKRVLVITAHADDAEFFAGGTLSRWASEGAIIEEIITTNNERGSFELASTELAKQSREIEARNAAKVLGKQEIYFLEYPDGFLGDTPINELRAIYMRHIRRFKPDIMMTFDPWAPFESHPDHRQVGMAAVEAVGFAHLPLYHPEHFENGIKPHQTPTRYYFAKDPERCDTVVDISEYVTKKVDALCAHDSQMKMTIDEIRMDLEVTGQKPELLTMLDRENYRPGLEMMINVWAASVGEKYGIQAGEEFRFEQVGDLFTSFGND
jgi:LmbE family N-acetylglucosaminyl deacetylase